jgi:hypothetical protein
MASRFPILPGESREDFEATVTALLAEHSPPGPATKIAARIASGLALPISGTGHAQPTRRITHRIGKNADAGKKLRGRAGNSAKPLPELVGATRLYAEEAGISALCIRVTAARPRAHSGIKGLAHGPETAALRAVGTHAEPC